jgi:uncharacterized Zn finger protein
MEQNRLDQVVRVLQSKGVNKACPRCGHMKFSVIGETLIPLHENPNSFVIGGPSIPVVIVACDNCGYITQHASVPLGLTTGTK